MCSALMSSSFDEFSPAASEQILIIRTKYLPQSNSFSCQHAQQCGARVCGDVVASPAISHILCYHICLPSFTERTQQLHAGGLGGGVCGGVGGVMMVHSTLIMC